MTLMNDFNWLDASTFVVNQLSIAIGSVVLVSLIWFVLIGFATLLYTEGEIKTLKPIFICAVLWIFSIVFTIVVCLVPTHERVLEVKISKIKNEAVSKENIDKGVKKIEEVLTKLECKYLECEGKK